MNNKKLWFLIGGVLCAALIVWVVLIVNIFGRDTESTDSAKKGKTKEKEYQYERFLIPAACATDMDKEQLLIEKSAKE